MIPKIELLAPGGDIDSIKAAIVAGTFATADVHCEEKVSGKRKTTENVKSRK